MSIQGEMRFSLGLDSAGFAVGANQALELVGKIGRGMSVVVNAVLGEWKELGKLNELAGMLRTTAGEVYGLQRAFEAAGASSQGVNSAVAFLRRSLGGTDEMGGKTAGIFADMGLDPESLKGQSAGAQISAVLEKLRELDDESKQFAARKLFGGMAQEMILASSQLDDFKEGLQRAESTTEAVNHAAAGAERLFDNWAFFNAELKQTVTQFAMELLPNMREAAELAAGISTGRIGSGFGQEFRANLDGIAQALHALFAFDRTEYGDSPADFLTDAYNYGYNASMEEMNAELSTPARRPAEMIAAEGTRHIDRSSPEEKAKKARDLDSGSGVRGPNVSDLQRMGFMFNTGAGTSDFAQQTAANTREGTAVLKSCLRVWQDAVRTGQPRDFTLE